ncbi:MAG: sensor histidine kinase [Ignavibacteriaceae bacterium]
MKLNNNAGISKNASLFSKFQTIHISDKNYRIYWSFVDVEDNTPYVLETAASLDFIYSDLHDLQILFLIIIPFALIITEFTAYVISKAAFKPITQMAKTAKLISAISLDRRLDELLTDCVQSINQIALKKNVRIDLSINDAVEIKADKEKLKSVFIYLIDNAIKYSNTGTEASVTLNKIENEKAVVTVEDKGEGISPEELPHIFKRFYRSNEIRAEINGSGLGLTNAKEIIEMNHGTITVESMLGKGTIFKVIFPS